MHRVSIVGCGYTGLRLAERLRASQRVVTGFAVRPESLGRIARKGVGAESLNLDLPLEAKLDFSDQLVFYCVPPAAEGAQDPRLERLLGAIDGNPRRMIYLSTTGIYGDRAGARADEDTPPQPRTPRALRRLAAETTLRAWAGAREVSWTILRVPGIYGPGRLPLERLARLDPAIEPGEATPGNRIHVDDLVSACVAAGSSPHADGRIFNVTDGSDDSLTSYLQRVAAIAGLPAPPLVSRAVAEKTLSASSWSFLGESRRVDNQRLLRELGVVIRYRDLDEGIRASLADKTD